MADIDARADFGGLHVDRNGVGLKQRGLGEFMRQVMAVNRHLHHLRGGQLVAQHHQHLADRRAAGFRRRGDFSDHQLSVLGIAAVIRADQDLVHHAFVVRHHGGDAGADRQAAGDAAHAALEHFGDGDVPAAFVIDVDDADQHAVAMETFAQLARIQEAVVTAAFEFHETEAVRMRHHGATQKIQLRGRGETAAPVLQQLSVAQHGLQTALQGLKAVGCVEFQGLGDFFLVLRAVGIAQELQQAFTAQDGVLVLLGFTLVMLVYGLAVRR